MTRCNLWQQALCSPATSGGVTVGSRRIQFSLSLVRSHFVTSAGVCDHTTRSVKVHRASRHTLQMSSCYEIMEMKKATLTQWVQNNKYSIQGSVKWRAHSGQLPKKIMTYKMQFSSTKKDLQLKNWYALYILIKKLSMTDTRCKCKIVWKNKKVHGS